ncbi:MAG: hypothetical protein JNL18_17985 [Planctomycetaceae bacterium]|nr:hypothetical protein [Planctomycetaceae bacterium]
MSIARHHAEWLSLVPVSGPFLSLPVLMEAFPQGLEPHDPDLTRFLRQQHAAWQEASEKRRADPVPQREWINSVLTQVLELDTTLLAEGQAIPQSLQVEVPEHHELLRPSFVLNDPSTQKPRLLVKTYPRSQELTSYVAASRWKASPDTHMTELLHATGVRLGLVTNGEHWMLVDAPKGETTGYASWYASLWLEEPLTLRAFRSLLSASRIFGVSEDQTLEELLKKSASNQQEVTDQLGYQVRKAVEVLIHSLDKADQDFGRSLLADVPEGVLYESALTVMMRLVFLFCAEERELIPSKPFPVYEQNYSVSTISKQLRELADQHGEELLERRFDAWPRLLAAFRAVYGGLQHDDVHIPAYGGSLFNPDRFPFLEGRKARTTWREAEAVPLPVNNRTVLHLLEALQLLQVKVPGKGPGEARRLSFRALDIEQIGHVYEGLLDHTARRATEPYLGLAGTRAKEPEIPLAELEQRLAKSEGDLLKYLKEATGKTEKALKKSLSTEFDQPAIARFRSACQGNDELWKRVEPFAGLVRLDSFGYPVVIPEKSVFVTAGTDRRSSGTHYTPRSLTEPIVQYTLEPLAYVGPAEGTPKEKWKLKSAKELLGLKICDIACGSGAFLVQAARYMSERLLEAWDDVIQANPGTPGITPEGVPSSGNLSESLIPDDAIERKTYAMRLIAQRCLYGVDKNPLAVEMAKLSLWLLTVAKDKPFEFLDHSIRCGDSLVGLYTIKQLRHFRLDPDADDGVLFTGPLDQAVDEAIALRLKLEDMPANTVDDVQRQEKLLTEATEKIALLRYAADLLVAAEFWGENAKDMQERVRHAAVKSGHYVEKGPVEEFKQVAVKERRGQVMFHWPLEFPEVVVKRGGFDAFLGNPPFMAGRFISGQLGDDYLRHLKTKSEVNAGQTDLCAYFVLQATALLRNDSCCGLVTTNTISQGDTREVALEWLLSTGFQIPRAISSQKWPGAANLHISNIWLYKGQWSGSHLLDGSPVDSIGPFLTSTDAVLCTPFRLESNRGKSFTGNKVYGEGFVLAPDEAKQLLDSNPSNREVLFPFIIGGDLKSKDQKPQRWVIDFGDRTSEDAQHYIDCFRIVKERVKPYRDKVKREHTRKNWWLHEHSRTELYQAIRGHERVLFHGYVGKYLCFGFVSTDVVFGAPHVVIALYTHDYFAVLQSSIHESWCRRYSSTLEDRLCYTSSDVFETFPFPEPIKTLAMDCSCPSLLKLGADYEEARRRVSEIRGHGFTDTYNLVHSSSDFPEVQSLRDLQVELDQTVATAYDWTDIPLGHGFHETKQGIRFTISESARHEVLQRLLKLNHERYSEEVKQGLHSKKKGAAKKAAPKKKSAIKPAKQEASLFGDEDDA